MKIIMISAMTNDRVIGFNNKLPWKIKEELQYFRQVTLNKPIIMGSKTFISLKKPLIDRYNIVLTKDINKFKEIISQRLEENHFSKDQNLIFVNNIQDGLIGAQNFYLNQYSNQVLNQDLNIYSNKNLYQNLNTDLNKESNNKLFKDLYKHKQEVFIIGGREIYLQFLPLAEELYLSIIKYNYFGNVFFPEFDINQWELIASQDHKEFVAQVFRKRY